MTLNISVLTPSMIYMSNDYRLFDNNKRQPLQIPSTKAVSLVNNEWTGLITYTGLGLVNSKHTSEFIRDWLSDKEDASFADMAEVIRDKASSWIRKFSPGQRHTFVLAAFLDGTAIAATISNYQRWQGAELDTVRDQFITSETSASRKPKVIVTGNRDAVQRSTIQYLQRISENYSNDPGRVRQALAKANRAGAKNDPNHISADCFVRSLDRQGQGHGQVFGDARTDLSSMMGGADRTSQIRSILDKTFGPAAWTVKGGTLGRSPYKSEVAKACEPKLSPQASGGQYRLVQLARPNGERAKPFAVNSEGVFVGQGAPRWPGPCYPCIWRQRETVDFLAHFGGYGGAAYDINNSGMIVGATELPDRTLHACIWRTDEHLDIGAVLGLHSAVKKVNDGGSAVGWVSIHPRESGQMHHRPAFWPSDGAPAVLEDLEGAWGESVDINEDGLILIRFHTGLGLSVGAWLWDGKNSWKINSPNPDWRSFWPLLVTEDDAVIGVTIGNNYRRGVALCDASGSWYILVTPKRGRIPTAANGNLITAGHDEIDDYNIPWIKSQNEEVTYLPHFQYHHHRPMMISDSGWVVGEATTDNCYHPLVWVPEGPVSDSSLR